MRKSLLLLLATLAWPLCAGAQSFVAADWQVVCDNTRTCRAAGYQRDGDGAAVSVLFTRRAGPNAPVSGELQLGDMGRGGPYPSSVMVSIAGKSAGTIALQRDRHDAVLGGNVVEALLRALVGNGSVAFVAGKSRWLLSGDGAAAVLQKMDDLQGRLDTPTAITRRGRVGTDNVLLPVGASTLRAGRIAGIAQPGDDTLAGLILSRIPHADDCPALDDSDTARDPANAPRLWRIDAYRVLLRAPCWRAGARTSDGYWVAIVKPPYDARRLTPYGVGYDGVATVSARHADRDRGDCATVEAWTWNGYAFEQTAAATGGLCREVAVGGAWNLPTVVTEVIPAK